MAFAHSLSGFRPSARRELLSSNCKRDRSIESKFLSIESSSFSIRWILRPFMKGTSMMTRKNLSSVGHGNFRAAIQSRWSSTSTSFPGTGDARHLLETAVHNYFAYRAKLNRLEFRYLLKQGRTSLMIGLAFLAACILMSQLLRQRAGTLPIVLREGLIIAGWVAMWRPMEIFLYEWWPLLRRGRLYEKLSRMRVEVRKRNQ